MGLFERMGENVERFKQEVTTAKTDSAEYRCESCETLVYSTVDRCPACGGESIEPIDPTSAGADDAARSERNGSETEEREAEASERRAEAEEGGVDAAEKQVETEGGEAEASEQRTEENRGRDTDGAQSER